MRHMLGNLSPNYFERTKRYMMLRASRQGEDLTVSGTPPLSLPNSLGKPLKAWAVDLLPYQEGSGDPAPDNVRPIHGTDKVTITTAGKNLYNMALQETDSSNSFYGFAPMNNTDYTFTVGIVSRGIYVAYSDDELMPNLTSNNWTRLAVIYNNTTISFNSGTHKWVRLTIYMADGLVDTTYQLEFGSTATPYTPYLAPSQTVIDVPVLSANKWDEEWEVGSINAQSGEPVASTTQIRSKNYSPCQPNTNYYGYCGAGRNIMNIFWYDANHNFISAQSLSQISASPSNAYYFKIRGDNAYGTTYLHDISINYPSTVTTYNPYNATVYTATIGSEGGESRWGEVDLGSNVFSWTYDNSGKRWQSTLNGLKSFATRSADILAEKYKADITASAGSENVMFTVGGAIYIYYSDSINKPSGQLVYPLATPTTFVVPSVTIPTPTGTATTWATAEDGTVESMEVTYVGKA